MILAAPASSTYCYIKLVKPTDFVDPYGAKNHLHKNEKYLSFEPTWPFCNPLVPEHIADKLFLIIVLSSYASGCMACNTFALSNNYTAI